MKQRMKISHETSCAGGAPQGMKMGFSGRKRERSSPCDTSIGEKRLLEGRFLLVTTQVRLRRLTRVGKGTTFGRTQKWEGRVAVSVTDLQTQQSPRKEALCKPWWSVVVDGMCIRPRWWLAG